MSRRLLLLLLVAVFSVSLAAPAAAGADDSTGLGSLEPGSGPPGTTISYTVVGSPDADSECRGSSAFATELLDATGVRIATGDDTITVPDAAAAGEAFLHLICYVADATGRRVIYGVCSSLEVTAAGAPTGAAKTATSGPTINEPCPATPRLVASEAVIETQTTLGLTFNQILSGIG